jgi:hypothetical protein
MLLCLLARVFASRVPSARNQRAQPIFIDKRPFFADKAGNLLPQALATGAPLALLVFQLLKLSKLLGREHGPDLLSVLSLGGFQVLAHAAPAAAGLHLVAPGQHVLAPGQQNGFQPGLLVGAEAQFFGEVLGAALGLLVGRFLSGGAAGGE